MWLAEHVATAIPFMLTLAKGLGLSRRPIDYAPLGLLIVALLIAAVVFRKLVR